ALRGANQLLNAAAALAALEALRPKLVVPQQAVRIGLSQAALPGRLQILAGTPTIILDVAHNPHAAAALGQNLDSMGYFPHTHAVLGMLNDKDIAGVVAKLAHRVDRWYCAGLPGPRGTSGQALADVVRSVVSSTSAAPSREESSQEARRAQLAGQGGEGRPGVRAHALAPVAADSVSVSSFDNPVQAFTEARKQASESDRILVFGSFATVGPVLHELGRA
ncbi:MAG: cyanophycin synthetase, partial [Pusillimonas sp.]